MGESSEPTVQTRLSGEQHDDVHHRDISGGGARAAVFGVSDGLVSNVALVLGVAAAHPSSAVVRLAGLAGLLGGSWSMAAGEYVSMRAQRELFERELSLERAEIARRPEAETRELAQVYSRRGLDPELAHQLAESLMRDPELALSAHAREELGLDLGNLGSPVQAAVFSFLSFAVGAALPLLPWLFLVSARAVQASVLLAGLSALAVGAALARFTGRSVIRSAARQLLISGVAAAVTYAVGGLLR